jgi:outer membrane protein TolC
MSVDFGQAGNSTGVGRVSEIDAAIARLREELKSNEHAIGNLIGRLEPVLRPSNTKNAPSDGKPEVVISPLARTIHELCEQEFELGHLISDVAARLEL